jgi:hypothetical protein
MEILLLVQQHLLEHNVKIFLTELEAYGTLFAGPNIIASTFERAEEAATRNNLVVVGELDSIYIDSDDMEHNNVIAHPTDGNIH